MQLVKMTAVQLSQLNIPNPDTMKLTTEAAWRSRDGQYAVLQVCLYGYSYRDKDEQSRYLRVYLTDGRGIAMPLHMDLLCDSGVASFLLMEIDSILADKPDRMELSDRLSKLWYAASRPNADGNRSQITIQGYAQYKTKGNDDSGEDQGQ